MKFLFIIILIVLIIIQLYNKDILKSKGIFRISGSINDEEKLKKAIMHNDIDEILNIKDYNVVAGAMRKLFRELKTPLFPYDLYEELKILSSKLFEFLNNL